jgi:hypothetical protein
VAAPVAAPAAIAPAVLLLSLLLGAALAPLLLQESETGFISETLNLLSEPIEPVAEICLPTCASSPLPSSL